MDIIAEIRRRHLVSGESISAIARDLKLSRPTVRKHLQTTTEPVYQRQQQPVPKLGEFQACLLAGVAMTLARPPRLRLPRPPSPGKRWTARRRW